MKVKVNIPTELRDLSVMQYASYLNMIDQYEAMRDDSKNPDIFYNLKTLEIFCGINYEDGMRLRVQDVNRIVSNIEKLLLEKPDLITTFTIGDTTFGFIPKLDDMTFGEYIDLDTNISNWDNMYKAMAVLYRPLEKKDGDKYLIQEYKGDLYHEAMKHTPLDVAFSSLLFFYHLGIDLSKGMRKYLEEQMTEEDSLRLKTLEESGVGINRSIRLLGEMLENMTI